MFKLLGAAVGIWLGAAFSLSAETSRDWSALAAEKGLAGALEGATPSTPSDHFAVGGLQFLRAIETAFQARTEQGLTMPIPLPVFRVPLDDGTTPLAPRPEAMREIAERVIADMEQVRQSLAQATGDVAVVLDLSTLWFDLNANGKRDPEEAVADVANVPPIVVRFDESDRHWLKAYTHVLSAGSHLVTAYDPTQALERVLTVKATRGVVPRSMGIVSALDIAEVIVASLRQDPDVEAVRALDQHVAMVFSENQTFWEMVARETDNDREFIPNANQKSALPMPFAPETGERWLAVLSDLQAVWSGELLIPHPLFEMGHGVNLRRLLDNPIPIHPLGWVQGSEAIPFLEQGPKINSESWERFDRLFAGNGVWMAVVLN